MKIINDVYFHIRRVHRGPVPFWLFARRERDVECIDSSQINFE